LALFVKHAAVISAGRLGTLYDPQNTEDVESYSATVEADGATVEANGATVLATPYAMDDGSNGFCSAALLDAREWTEVTRKAKTRKAGRPPGMQESTERSQEASPVKE
jgi:hypothetical protein